MIYKPQPEKRPVFGGCFQCSEKTAMRLDNREREAYDSPKPMREKSSSPAARQREPLRVGRRYVRRG